MLLTGEFIRKLKGRVHYTLPKGHLSPYEWLYKFLGHVKVMEGSRHENIAEAEALLKESGWSGRIQDFKCILVVIRNPYDYMVSRFFYLKDIQRHNRGGRAASIAAKGDFREYVMTAPDPYDPKGFLVDEGGKTLRNMSIVKYESLQTDLNNVVQPYLKSPISFRHKVNSSVRDDFKNYIVDPEIETAIYKRFHFLYDQGYYERLTF